MNRLEQEYAGQVAFYHLDVGDPEMEQVQLSFDLRGHPTIVVLDQEGQVMARFFGAQPAEPLRMALDQVLE